jgi:hypothetical protein
MTVDPRRVVARHLYATSQGDLPMRADEFIAWDDPRRDRRTGKIMVPVATDVAAYLNSMLRRHPATKGLKAEAKHGAVIIEDSEGILAIVSKHTRNNDIYFEVPPATDDHQVSDLLFRALEGFRDNFRPWDQTGRYANELTDQRFERGRGMNAFSKQAELRIPLEGHDNPNNAYMVDDYPYGRRLRCRIRYWLESTPSKGFRFVSQTEDPVKLRWNAPKKSTYQLFAGAMYLDSKEHVQWTGLNEYATPMQALAFVKDFPGADYRLLTPFVKKKVKFLEGLIDGSIVFTTNGVKNPPSDEKIGEYRKELEGWQEVLKRL